jgi:heterotetrameric sarcosine oxidase gamma subunit
MFRIDPTRSLDGGLGVSTVVGDANTQGVLAAGVPMTIPGLCAALARFGTLPLAVVLAPALAALPHSLVEVSDRQVAIPLEGPGAALILNAVMPLDLHLDAFPVGMATRTVFERCDVTLWRTGENAFHIEVWRSFAPYVAELIALISAENAAA